MLTAKEYSLLDISRFVRGMSFSLQQLADNEGDGFWRLKVPDPAALIAEYENALKAPMKHLFILEEAGHFAFFTDPQKFSKIMIDILNRAHP